VSLVEGNSLNCSEIGSKISRCMFVEGVVKSCEPILIDGRVIGNIESEDRVDIKRGAFVVGAIVARVVNIDGRVEGPIEAQEVKIDNNGFLEGYIIAKRVVIKGKSDGEVLARESLIVEKEGILNTYEAKSNEVIIYGKVVGDVVANEVLDVKKGAVIEGNVKAKELKSQIGSKIFGSVNRYVNSIKKNENSKNKNEKKSINSNNKVERKIKRF